jgi:hypothetical protein
MTWSGRDLHNAACAMGSLLSLKIKPEQDAMRRADNLPVHVSGEPPASVAVREWFAMPARLFPSHPSNIPEKDRLPEWTMRTKANYYPSGFISTTGCCSQDTRAGTYVNLPLRYQMLLPPVPRLRDPISNCSCANAGIRITASKLRRKR